MKVGTDANGKVWMVGSGIPSELNGIALTIHDLTPEQEAQYKALRGDRVSTTFDGHTFTAVGTRVD